MDADDLEELSGYLTALAHPNRLELLAQLRTPRTVREMHLRPRRDEAEGNPDRAISRAAVEKHLGLLKAIGVVTSRPGERDGRRVEEYLLQRARLFQVVERLRDLTLLRPIEDLGIDRTELGDQPRAPRLSSAPALVVLSGPLEGHAFPVGERCTVGRAAPCDVVLEYDAYLSSEHFAVERTREGRFVLRESPTARNGTRLNWATLPRGAVAPLRHGDVVRAGRTTLMLHDPRDLK